MISSIGSAWPSLKIVSEADVDIDIIHVSRRLRLLSLLAYYRWFAFHSMRHAGFVLSFCFPFRRSILFLHFSFHLYDVGRHDQLGLVQCFQQAHLGPCFVL